MSEEPRFSLLNALSESRLIPSVKALATYDADELAELAYLHILGLRILLCEPDTAAHARIICRKTASSGNFRRWRTDATDLYALLHGLIGQDHPDGPKHVNDFADYHRVSQGAILNWLNAGAREQRFEDQTARLFVRLDIMFRIGNGSMRALRRLIMEWPDLTVHERRLAMTRLLQFFRSRAPKGELLPLLNRAARNGNLELHGVCDRETGEGCGAQAQDEPFLEPHERGHRKRGTGLIAHLAAGAVGALAAHAISKRLHAKEGATAGATAAANVATVAGGLGAGFDDDYSKSIYPAPKGDRGPKVIKRST